MPCLGMHSLPHQLAVLTVRCACADLLPRLLTPAFLTLAWPATRVCASAVVHNM